MHFVELIISLMSLTKSAKSRIILMSAISSVGRTRQDIIVMLTNKGSEGTLNLCRITEGWMYVLNKLVWVLGVLQDIMGHYWHPLKELWNLQKSTNMKRSSKITHCLSTHANINYETLKFLRMSGVFDWKSWNHLVQANCY